MIENFIKEYAKLIATHPEKITTSINNLENNIVEIVVNADKVDAGRLIGKGGKTISMIKVFISGIKPQYAFNYKVSVKAIDEITS